MKHYVGNDLPNERSNMDDELRTKALLAATALLDTLPVPSEQYATLHHAVTLGYLDGYRDGHKAATASAIEIVKR